MFWRFGTGKKMPGRKIAVIAGAATACAVALGLLARDAAARPEFRDKKYSTRVRLSMSLGMINYSSFSFASNSITQFSAYPSLGQQFEAERYFRSHLKGWPTFGAYAEGERYPIRLLGRPIQYSSVTAGAAYRLTGSRDRDWNHNEVVLRVGANFQTFPDVRGYAGTNTFDLYKPDTLGAKAELRWRLVLNRKRDKRLDLGMHYIVPWSLFRPYDATLDRKLSRGYGADGFFMYTVSPKVDLGFGMLYEANRLYYVPPATKFPQQVDWTNIAPQLSIQFWF